MIERILTSPRLYWLFRIGWAERAIFLTVRFFGRFVPPARTVLLADLFGFDFSKWQGVIDFLKVWLYGAKFIILRAASGLVADERFVEYMQTVLTWFSGKLSVYHYYRPGVDPIVQANKLIAIITPYKQSIRRVWGDFEFSESGAWSAPTHWQKYAETIVAAGFRFGVYTRKTWWDSRVGTLASWFGQFPLWAAQYAPALTLIPRGWAKADQWQTGTPVIGHAVGTQSLEVDHDICDDEFYMMEYDGVVEPPTGGSMYYKATGNISIRTGGGTSFPLIGGANQYVLINDIVEAGLSVNGFVKIIKLYRNDVVVPLPVEAYCGTAYLTQTTYTPPTLPPATEYPATIENTVVFKDADGTALATYAGTLNKQ